MTRDDIIRMARESGMLIPSFRIGGGLALGTCTVPDFERFAGLVAKFEREALRAKIEAAEKSDAESLAMYRKSRDERDALRAALRHEADCVEAAKAALRARIEAMEKQEPARLVTPTAYRWRRRGSVMWQYGELTEETVRLAKEHNHEVQPLYALPGAQPAPSVKDAIIDDLQSQFDSEGITEHDSGDALIRLSDAIAAVEDNFVQPAPSVNEGVRKVTLGFRWESEEQHHIPTIEIEFDPVSPDSPNDARGWQDRDRIASMLSPEAKP